MILPTKEFLASEEVFGLPTLSVRRHLNDTHRERSEFENALVDEWGINLDTCELVRPGQNVVFAANDEDGEAVIVRATSNAHRSQEQVRAELEWIRFLDDVGVPVASLIEARSSKPVVSIINNERPFHLACFKRLDGTTLEGSRLERWDEELIRQWGRTIGLVHRWSKRFQSRGPKRYQWHELPELVLRGRRPDLFDEKVVARIDELFARLQTTKVDDSYLLVHGDIWPENFLVSDDEFVLFDFDQSMYCWKLYDLVVAFHAQYVHTLGEEPIIDGSQAGRFWKLLIEGYRDEARLEPEELRLAEPLLRLRLALDYMNSASEPKKWAASLNMPLEDYIPVVDGMGRSLLSDERIAPIDLTDV
ncbi:serine/threonine protein kinase [Planctomycetes bacterium Pan216]|uniref:Serine/threonine protein kinase n=1 Tax=Kolteria novifilia TaxID=2527975 RepID=A0A518B7D5_9BACT|nr:serine/threonine protein kinase [Planctomycetes bacterium Pan216]